MGCSSSGAPRPVGSTIFIILLGILVFGLTFISAKKTTTANNNSKTASTSSASTNSTLIYLLAGGLTALWGLLNIIKTIRGLANGVDFTFMTFLRFVNGVTLIGIGGLFVVMRNPMLLTLAFAFLAFITLIFFISDIIYLVRLSKFTEVSASSYIAIILENLSVLLICGIAIAKFLNLMPAIVNLHWLPESLYTIAFLVSSSYDYNFLFILTLFTTIGALMMLGKAIFQFNND